MTERQNVEITSISFLSARLLIQLSCVDITSSAFFCARLLFKLSNVFIYVRASKEYLGLVLGVYDRRYQRVHNDCNQCASPCLCVSQREMTVAIYIPVWESDRPLIVNKEGSLTTVTHSRLSVHRLGPCA